MSALAAAKAEARAAAFERRKAAYDTGDRAAGAARLAEVLAGYRGKVLSGYMPMRTEIDPLPAMAEHAASGDVCVPVIVAKGAPLVFHRWTPEAPMQDGPFGARVPVTADERVPEVLIVPLVAYDRQGGRLGYGGGFYDRTLEGLRQKGPVAAIGFAWAAQEAENLPLEPTDQPLDLIVTENGIIEFGRA